MSLCRIMADLWKFTYYRVAKTVDKILVWLPYSLYNILMIDYKSNILTSDTNSQITKKVGSPN